MLAKAHLHSGVGHAEKSARIDHTRTWVRLGEPLTAICYCLLPSSGGSATEIFGNPNFEAGGLCQQSSCENQVTCYNPRMNMQLKVTKIGNSAGVILPKELLAHLETTVGGELSVTKTPRGIELAPPATDFDAQMAAARDVMARRKRALAELAK